MDSSASPSCSSSIAVTAISRPSLSATTSWVVSSIRHCAIAAMYPRECERFSPFCYSSPFQDHPMSWVAPRRHILERLPDVMALLRDRVPVTLLLDLLPDSGPSSAEIYNAECADLRWT